jgi:hypothetical protein
MRVVNESGAEVNHQPHTVIYLLLKHGAAKHFIDIVVSMNTFKSYVFFDNAVQDFMLVVVNHQLDPNARVQVELDALKKVFKIN